MAKCIDGHGRTAKFGSDVLRSRLVSFTGVQACCMRLRRMGEKEFEGSEIKGRQSFGVVYGCSSLLYAFEKNRRKKSLTVV